MPRFNDDNTDGYTPVQLDAMNDEYDRRAEGESDGSVRDRIAEDVCRWMDAHPTFGVCDVCGDSGPTEDGTTSTVWECPDHPASAVHYYNA